MIARFPRGATFNIVCPNDFPDVIIRVSDNIENGTSAARGSFPRGFPEHPDCPLFGEAVVGDRNSEFRIPNSEFLSILSR